MWDTLFSPSRFRWKITRDTFHLYGNSISRISDFFCLTGATCSSLLFDIHYFDRCALPTFSGDCCHKGEPSRNLAGNHLLKPGVDCSLFCFQCWRVISHQSINIQVIHHFSISSIQNNYFLSLHLLTEIKRQGARYVNILGHVFKCEYNCRVLIINPDETSTGTWV